MFFNHSSVDDCINILHSKICLQWLSLCAKSFYLFRMCSFNCYEKVLTTKINQTHNTSQLTYLLPFSDRHKYFCFWFHKILSRQLLMLSLVLAVEACFHCFIRNASYSMRFFLYCSGRYRPIWCETLRFAP